MKVIADKSALLDALECSKKEIGVSLGLLAGRQEALHDAEIILRDAKDVVLLEFLDNPKELGSNEAARDANLRNRVRIEQVAFDKAEYEVIVARARVEAARLTFDHLRAMVRIYELADVEEANIV